MAEGITASINNLVKLVQGISGVEISFAGVVNNVNALNTKMLQVTYNLGAFSKGFADVSSQVNTLSEKFNYTQGSVASMIETLGTGFRKPITDMGEMELILKRSQTLFGANENAAMQFIQQIAKIEQTAGPLRHIYLDLTKLIQKSDQGTASGAEIERMKKLQGLGEAELMFKFYRGEIDRKTLNMTLATLDAESDLGDTAVKSRKDALQLSKSINDAQHANVAATKAATELMNKHMETVGKFMGATVSAGSVVVGSSIQFVSAAFKEFAKEGDKGIERLLGKDNAAVKGMEEAISAARKKHGIDTTEEHIKEEYKALHIEKSGGEISKEQSEKLLSIALKSQEVQDLLKISQADTASAAKKYSNEEFKAREISKQQTTDLAQKAKELGQEYSYVSQILSEQNQLSVEIAVNAARMGKNYGYEDIYNSAMQFEEALQMQKKTLSEQLESVKAMQAVYAEQIANAKTDKDRNVAIQMEQGARLDILRIQKEQASLTDQGLARLNAINAARDKQASFIKAELDYQKQLISLQDNFAVGISANAAAREKAAQLSIEQANVEKGRIKDLEATKKAISDSGGDLARINEIEREITEAKTRHLSLTKEALDATQKMREGYLDAIDSMQSGAGMFTEIVADQNKSLGALVRTTEEMPRVLRTGAGSGGILEAGQFGPGGISGGFDPNSPEYSKHVLRNMEDVQSLLSEMPKQIGDSIGSHLGWAAKGREEFGGQIAETAKPGEVGEIKAKYPSVPPSGQAAGSSPPKGSLEDMLRFTRSFDELSEEEKQDYIEQKKKFAESARTADKQEKEKAKKKEETAAPASKSQRLSLSKEEEEKIRKQIEELDKEYMEAMKQVDEINQSAQYIRDIGKNASQDDPLFEEMESYRRPRQEQESEEYRSKAMSQNLARRKDIEEKRKKALERLGGGKDIQQVASGGSGSPDTGGKVKQEAAKTEEPTSQKTYTAQEHREALNAMVAQVSHEVHIGVVNAVKMGMAKAMKELATSTA